MVQNAHPTNSDIFRSGCQPEILDGTTGTVQIRIGYRRPAQHMLTATLPATCDTDINRCFLNSFELEASIECRTGIVIVLSCLSVRFLKKLFHRTLCCALTDNHKIPRLHKPDRPGMMRCGQDPRKHSSRNGRLYKVLANVPALKNHPVDSSPFRIGKPPIPVIQQVGLRTHSTLLRQRWALSGSWRIHRLRCDRIEGAGTDKLQAGRTEAILK